MSRSLLLRATGATALAFALAACGDSTTAPTIRDLDRQETLDVAMVAGDAAVEDVAIMGTQQNALGQPVPPGHRTGPWGGAGCDYDPGTGRVTCPQVTHDGLTISRSVRFEDASGAPQPAYDAQTTASAHFLTTVSGTVVRPMFSGTFTRQRDITVSGLLGDETTQIFDGTGSSSQSHTQHMAGGAARAYTMTQSTVIDDVVVPVPRTATSWPLSGTITRQVSFSRDGARGEGRSGTRTIVVTFNGTQLVPMTVNGVQFTLDLATGEVTPA